MFYFIINIDLLLKNMGRKLDTESVVYSRNRVRLSCLLQLFGCIIYLAIVETLQQTHLSFIHLAHIIFQPLIFFISLAESSIYTYAALLCSAVLSIADVGVLILNFIAVNRCLSTPSALCADSIWEKGILAVLAAWFIIFDFLQATQLYRLRIQLEEKDHAEEHSEEEHNTDFIIVYAKKIRTIAIFLILFDIIHAILIATKVGDVPLLALGWSHVFIDVYTLLVVDLSYLKNTYILLQGVFGISVLINLILIVVSIQIGLTTIGDVFFFLTTILFFFADVAVVGFCSFATEAIHKAEKLK